jgi:uncharacterized protein (TIRG00374 family)
LETGLSPNVKKWVYLSALLGFTVFLLYLYFFTDITSVLSVIRTTNLFFYSLAFICVLAGVFFNALAWHGLLDKLSVTTSFQRVYSLSWVGIFVDAIIPGGWSGDLFKAYLLSKDPKVDGGKTAASIVVKNILEIWVTLGASVFGLIVLSLSYTLQSGVLFTIGTTLFLLTLPLIVIVYLTTNLGATKKMLRALKRLSAFVRRRPADTEKFEARIEKTLKEYHDGIVAFKDNPKALFQPVAFQALSWSFDILALFLIFASIGYFVPADKVIITNSISANLQTQGFALVGFAQVVSSNIYTILGISPILSAASTVLAGFASFWFKIVIAFFAFQSVVFSRCVPLFFTRRLSFKSRDCEDEAPLVQAGSE